MAKYKISYVYKRVGNNSGGVQTSKNVEAPSSSSAIAIVKSEMQSKGYEFYLREVKEI